MQNLTPLLEYLFHHPFAQYDKSFDAGDTDFAVLIKGVAGPQGKTTFESLCDECGIEHQTLLYGSTCGHFRKDKRVFVVDFGYNLLTKEQIDDYRKGGQ